MSALKKQEAFNQRVDTLLSQLQARKEENERQRYILPTKAGNLEIRVHEPQKTNVFSVYCRFKELEKAKPVMNIFENFDSTSGKFNFHYMDSELLLQVLENDLLHILN